MVFKLTSLFFPLTEQTRVTRDISLTEEELEFLGLAPRSHEPKNHRSNQLVRAIFRGKKLRTKFSFSCKMYDQEIKQWIEEETNAEQLNHFSAARRRAFSCKV